MPKTKRVASTIRNGPSEKLPQLCDLTCAHAGFAPPSAVGACRRDQAIYCALFKSLNNKHTRCIGRRESTAPAVGRT